jgi:hypothetical protein
MALIARTDFGATHANQTFATPEEAVAALVAAADKQDSGDLHNLYGAAAAEMESPDPIQTGIEQEAFAKRLHQGTEIVRESDSRCVVDVGDTHWPYPIPIAKREGRWFFDGEAGKQEVINRRIGKDELATLKVLRACVEAQRDYSSEKRSGDDMLKFAKKISSTPGTKDGLYWPLNLDGEMSPLGPQLASAQPPVHKDESEDVQTGEPFHGYYFKVLSRQGKHAPGGKYDYVINGNMIGGFGFVAWPAAYGQSGIMTFVVNQQGCVYQKDLGSKTDKLAREMKEYDPDKTWTISPD